MARPGRHGDPVKLGRLQSPLSLVFRVGLLPVVIVVVMAALFYLGNAAVNTQHEAMTAVVETDLESTAHLARINTRLQSANADLYRLMTQAAAGTGAAPDMEELAGRIEAIVIDLKAYRDSEAAIAQRATLDEFIDGLSLYKGAIAWVASMLEVDFKAAVAFITPYNSLIDKLSRQLTAIIAETTAKAEMRAATSSAALQQVAYYYVIAAVVVCVLVSLFAYVMSRRHQVLYHAARIKTEQVETLLNNSGQGFLSFGADLAVADWYSRACEGMFGRVPAGKAADDLMFPDDPHARELMRAAVASATAAEPARRSVILSLLPNEVDLGGNTLEAEYRPLDDGSIMVVLTDVTEARVLARQVERERKRLEMIVAAVTDGQDFFDAVEAFRAFIGPGLGALAASATPAEVMAEAYREVHTYKGTFNQFGFQHLPAALHDLEGRLQGLRDLPEPPSAETVRRLIVEAGCLVRLDTDLVSVREALGDDFVDSRGTITLTLADVKRLEELAGRLRATAMPEVRELCDRLSALRRISFKAALADFDRLVQRVAERCDKEVAPVEASGDDIRVDPDRFMPLLRALGHLFRNAVDHGIEDPDTRIAAGKDECGVIRCTLTEGAGGFAVEIADDGAGIDREALRRRAAECRGEAVAAQLSDAEIDDLVFEQGVSTRTEVSNISGRGVGLAAVRAAVQALGGTVRVDSRPGQGTRFTLTLPNPDVASKEAA